MDRWKLKSATVEFPVVATMPGALKFLTTGEICLFMRKLMTFTALLCGAASAEAAQLQKWCSNGFEKPAEILFDPGTATGGDRFEITIDGQLQPIDDEVGPYIARGADIYVYDEGTRGDKQDVVIYRDRIFWPCP